MRNRYCHALFLLCIATAVTGCQTGTLAAGDGILSPMNAGSEEIKGCGGSVPTPTKTIVMTFDNPTDLYRVTRNIQESGAAVPNAGSGAEYPIDATPTPLDFWPKLQSNNNNQRQSIQLKIVLLDPRLKFRKDKYAIVGDKPGEKMLCDLSVSADQKTATVTVKYDHTPNGKGGGVNKTYGSMNIGLMLDQGLGVELPVFVDPIVKNEG